VDLDGKRLQILKSALAGASRVLLIATPRDPTFRDRIALAERAARSLGLQIEITEVSGPGQLAAAFDTASRSRVGAMMVLGAKAHGRARTGDSRAGDFGVERVCGCRRTDELRHKRPRRCFGASPGMSIAF
jgi:hypothetical protein